MIEKLDVPEKSGGGHWIRFPQPDSTVGDRRPWIVAEWPKRAIEELNAIMREIHYDFVLCRYMRSSHPFLLLHGPEEKGDHRLRRSPLNLPFRSECEAGPGIYAGLKWHLQRKMLIGYQKRCLTLGAALSARRRPERGTGQRIRQCPCGPEHVPDRGTKFKSPTAAVTLTGAHSFCRGPRLRTEHYRTEVVPRWDIPQGQGAISRRKVPGRRQAASRGSRRTCRHHPGVELYPDVPDVGPYYEKCGAVVVPLLAGGGTRIKILEAAITGASRISTPLGAYGLGCGDGFT